MNIFTRIGLSQSLSFRAIKSLSEKYDSKNIIPGQELEFVFEPALPFDQREKPNATGKLRKIIFQPNLYHEYTITFDADQITTKLFNTDTKTKIFHIKGRINSSLYIAAVKSGLPLSLLMEMIRIYSWDIDFQRSIRSGDEFEIMYEGRVTPLGVLTRYGDLLFANLKLGNSNYPLYLFKAKDGSTDYFDQNGHSAQKSLMRTPINGARLTSGFGNRRHPILGFNKMHRGVDFAAPIGTPILAAGSGTIVFRSRNGSYGNYIRIRHNSKYSTAYAHLSRFNSDFKKGSRVRQGEVIGYVGTTGRSTGAHLHYEILRRGRQTNPMRVKMPSGKHLTGAELLKFNGIKDKITKALAELRLAKTPF
jgi:murein DD-endopeptidase MepM/ murein hydrolase activator NlpD